MQVNKRHTFSISYYINVVRFAKHIIKMAQNLKRIAYRRKRYEQSPEEYVWSGAKQNVRPKRHDVAERDGDHRGQLEANYQFPKRKNRLMAREKGD